MVVFADTLGAPLGQYWTSGTSQGVLSADHPGWCATNQFMDVKLWDDHNTRPWSLFRNRFLALELQTGEQFPDGVFDYEEDARFFVICEDNQAG